MAKQKKAQEVSAVRQAKHGWIITLLFTVLSVLWISPIFMVLLNSFKRKAYITFCLIYYYTNNSRFRVKSLQLWYVKAFL